MTLTLLQPVDKIQENLGGGKAQGLAFLKRKGVSIPETYVVSECLRKELPGFLKGLPNHRPYAVRSSSSGEDGELHSYAGQFQTFLNVNGKEALQEAITKCFNSAESENVASYSKNANGEGKNQMFVLVQEMVDAAFSGVLFTVDPVAGRHDKMSISYTIGLGEELMAGHEAGESVTFFKHAKELPQLKNIDSNLLRQIIDEAKYIEKKYGKPADLEWAIDKKGKLWWLQLRPITGLHQVHLNELDNNPLYDEPLYTRGNIGEMMPGPVTPLTLSTFGKAIELGLQVFYIKAGVLKKKSDEFLFIHSFYNHLFFDLNRMYEISKYNLFMKKENIDFSVVGQIVEGRSIDRVVGVIKGLRNFLSVNEYINQAPKAWQRLRIIYKYFKLKRPENIRDCYDLIDGNMPILMRAYDLHYVTSSQSGALYSAILNFYSGGKTPTRNDQEKVAALFNNIPNIESANVVISIDKISKMLASFDDVEEEFLEVNNDLALEFISKNGPYEIVDEWHELIARHGHRCIREAEMRELEWAVEPAHLLESLKSKTRLFLDGQKLKEIDMATPIFEIKKEDLGFIQRHVVKWMLPKARKAVVRREHTKAWAIGVQHQFKKAYRHLAKMMVNEGLLDDEGQIYFLQHSEIGQMIKSGEHAYWKKKASERRNQFPELQEMVFDDVVFGVPVPQEKAINSDAGNLSGVPVSQGVVVGKVRIVNSLADASSLKKGEIMVARYTDIGWTPFFSIISGLITEIGSPLSHGAVVAREYGIPAIVSMKGAMQNLETGQKIKLDAVKGEVVIIS
jgi:rifampicin phosphotransferase